MDYIPNYLCSFAEKKIYKLKTKTMKKFMDENFFA